MNAPTTTVQITTAHLCGPLGQALAVVDGQTWIYENGSRRRATANDIRFFFDLGLEVRPVDPSGSGPLTEDRLSVMLEQETRCFQALHDLLLGMDADLDDDLRMRSMRGADRLLADAAVAAFVERRFLRPVEKEKWDVAGARRLAGAERLSVVERLYAIVDGPLLLRMENEIRDWLSGQGLTSVERALEIERAYETGLVAALTSLSTTALERGPRVDIGETIIEARKVSWDRRLAAHLMERLFPWTTFSSSQSVIKHDAGGGTEKNYLQQLVCQHRRRQLDFFGIAIGKNADLAKLAQFSTRNLARLDGLKFREMFIWLSRSTSSASKAAHGTSVELLPPADWMQVSS